MTTLVPLATLGANPPHLAQFWRGGKLLAVAGDSEVFVHSHPDGALVWQLTTMGRPSALSANTQADCISVAESRGRLLLWRPLQGSTIQTLASPGVDVTALAFSPDSQILLAGNASGQVEIRSTSNPGPPRTLQVHQNMVCGFQFSRRGDMFASWDLHKVAVVEMNSGQAIRVPGLGELDYPESVRFSPDGSQVAVIGCFENCIFDLATGHEHARSWSGGWEEAPTWATEPLREPNPSDSARRLHQFSECSAGIVDITFSPDCQKITALATDASIQVWDLASRMRRYLNAPSLDGPVLHGNIAYSPEGHMLLVSTDDGEVAAYRVPGADVLFQATLPAKGDGSFSLKRPPAVAMCPATGSLVAASADGSVTAFSVDTHKAMWTTELPRRPQVQLPPPYRLPPAAHIEPTCLTCHRNKPWLFVGDATGKVRQFNAGTGALMASLEPEPSGDGLLRHDWRVRALAFTAEGRRLLIQRSEHLAFALYLSEVDDYTHYQAFPNAPHQSHLTGHHAWAVSSLHPLWACYDNNLVSVWDLTRDSELCSYPWHYDQPSLAFSPDSRILAMGGMDGVIQLWALSGSQ